MIALQFLFYTELFILLQLVKVIKKDGWNMKVLLTNDDGIDSPGLRALYFELKKRGHEVFAIAPMEQQSGKAHSVTVFKPILTKKIRDGEFEGVGVYGTPADCVKLGLGQMAPFRVDLTISGINQGPNAGPDIYYSGTVAAAAEAAQDGVPAMALSHLTFAGPADLEKVAAHAIDLAEKVAWEKIPHGTLLNVNYPDRLLEQSAGLRACAQSLAPWPNEYARHTDPRGEPYWWFASTLDPEKFGADTDRDLLAKGFVTITPLKLERTDHAALDALKEMPLS